MSIRICQNCFSKVPYKKEKEYLSCLRCFFSSKFEHFIPTYLYDVSKPEKYKEYAGHIHSSGAHLLDLIGSILDKAKVEAGRYALAPTLTAPGPIALECAEMVRGQAEKAGLELTVHIAPGLPETMLDARAVKQILIKMMFTVMMGK